MFGIFRIFFRTAGTSPWAVLVCLILASLAEGFGIATLLPLLSLATGSADEEPSPLALMVTDTFDAIGLEPDFAILLAIVVGGTVIKAIMTLFAMRYVGMAVAEVTTRLRTDLIRNVLGVRWGFFVAQPMGRITNAVASEAERAGIAFRAAAALLADSVQTVVFLGIALLLSWKLTLAAVVAGVGILWTLNFLVRVSGRAGRKQTDRMRELLIYLSDVLHNIKPLKAMAKERAFQAYLDSKISRLRKALRTQVTAAVSLKNSQEALIALVAGVGFYFAVTGWNVAITELVVMYIVIARVVKNLAKLQRENQHAASFVSPYEAIHDLIEETARASENLHSGATPSLETGWEFRRVSFSFGRNTVLRDVDVKGPDRSITLLTGLSGAGKSTLTDLLLGFYEPDEGDILIDGVSLKDLDVSKWRGMVGYVPQDLQLLHDTIYANVSLGDPQVDEAAAIAALKAAEAWDFVQETPDGLMTVVGEKGSRLSGGQRQRISLARALAAKPKLLILDEVTSGLDTQTEREICQTLAALKSERAILAISHRPHFLEIADHAYKVEDGRVTAMDPHAPAMVLSDAV